MKKQTYASVWDALEDTPEAAASMRVRALPKLAITNSKSVTYFGQSPFR